MNDVKSKYVSPECDVYVLAAEGVLCASMWYENGGRGSFDYTVDDTDDFGW